MLLTAIGAIGYVISAILIALLIYALLRKIFGSRAGEEDHNLSSSVVARLSTLHALIIALIFAQEMNNYLNVVDMVIEESGVIADSYYGVKRFDGEAGDVKAIQHDIANYVHTVINDEWILLSQDKTLSDNAWKIYDRVDEAVLRLQVDSDYQNDVRRQILDDWDELSNIRRGREAAASREIPSLFWALAIIGYTAVIVPFYVFPPRSAHLVILSVFAGFNGLVFYFIIEMSEPFSGSVAIKPLVIERVYHEDMYRLLEGG